MKPLYIYILLRHPFKDWYELINLEGAQTRRKWVENSVAVNLLIFEKWQMYCIIYYFDGNILFEKRNGKLKIINDFYFQYFPVSEFNKGTHVYNCMCVCRISYIFKSSNIKEIMWCYKKWINLVCIIFI